MLKLEEIKKDAHLEGVSHLSEPIQIGDDIASVFYVDLEGQPGTQMLYRSSEASLESGEIRQNLAIRCVWSGF